MSCGRSQSVVLTFDESPVEESEAMEFRLVYCGRVLGSSKTNSRAAVKHEIRREFHPQLRRLWETNASLRLLTHRMGAHYYDIQGQRNLEQQIEQQNLGKPPDILEAEDFYRQFAAEVITKQWRRNGYHFWPLVTEQFCLRCSLDILFLRPEEPGMLIQSGDLDARVKTIFDALRLPKNLDEAGGMEPQSGEDPFYCLLEDDKLISEVKVTTDNLLLLPKERDIKPNDAMMIIHAKLWPTKPSQWDWAFF